MSECQLLAVLGTGIPSALHVEPEPSGSKHPEYLYSHTDHLSQTAEISCCVDGRGGGGAAALHVGRQSLNTKCIAEATRETSISKIHPICLFMTPIGSSQTRVTSALFIVNSNEERMYLGKYKSTACSGGCIWVLASCTSF